MFEIVFVITFIGFFICYIIFDAKTGVHITSPLLLEKAQEEKIKMEQIPRIVEEYIKNRAEEQTVDVSRSVSFMKKNRSEMERPGYLFYSNIYSGRDFPANALKLSTWNFVEGKEFFRNMQDDTAVKRNVS